MAHHLYNTEGIILSHQPHGEANTLFTILTKELGLLRASAQSVRKPQSKLRANLQDFSRGTFSLIHSREYWKIVNVSDGENLYYFFENQQRIIRALARVFSLIIRLMPGEGFHPEIYITLEEGIQFLKDTIQLNEQAHVNDKIEINGFDETVPTFEDSITACEYIIVIRLLHHLGYLSADPIIEPYFNSNSVSELIVYTFQHKKKLTQEINRSLHETQL